MINLKDILLLGGGKHCASVIDSINSQGVYNPIGILDLQEKVGTYIQGIPVIGTDDSMLTYRKEGINFAFISIGSVGNTAIREKLVTLATEVGFQFPNIIDATAVVSSHAKLSNGVFVGKGTIVNTNSFIDNHAIVNTGAIVEHDCVVGKFVHIAPGSTFSGGVKIGNFTHIGTNSTIIQDVTIGNRALIGAGSVVIKNIADNQLAYGNPCKEV